MVRPLVGAGVLEPVAACDDDAQLWMSCDLCSFVENRFHHQLEPQVLSSREREAWSVRALTSHEQLWDPRRSEYAAPFWILDSGIRVGTLALSTMPVGHGLLPVFSLYTFPEHRHRGHVYRALRAVYEASVSVDLAGIRIGTFWTWQTALRRYLFRYGMWAWTFKRSIELVWLPDLPPHAITFDAHTARFAIDKAARLVELITASCDGDRLVWSESPEMSSRELDHTVTFHARSTLALALAVNGWPLLRAGDNLDDAAVYDAGGPDVLAYKIAMFDILDRQYGFDVRAPRIPGLPYDAVERKLAVDAAAS